MEPSTRCQPSWGSWKEFVNGPPADIDGSFTPGFIRSETTHRPVPGGVHGAGKFERSDAIEWSTTHDARVMLTDTAGMANTRRSDKEEHE